MDKEKWEWCYITSCIGRDGECGEWARRHDGHLKLNEEPVWNPGAEGVEEGDDLLGTEEEASMTKTKEVLQSVD